MKRYIGNTGEVYIVDDNKAYGKNGGRSERDMADSKSGSILGNLIGAPTVRAKPAKTPFGFEMGDVAVLALLFFLYRESGDDEFLIVLAFFAIGLFSK